MRWTAGSRASSRVRRVSVPSSTRSLNALKSLGWVAALCLAICCALRLARFNVALDDPDKPAWTMNFFTGAPAPAGAGLAMAPMYLGFLGLIPDGHVIAWLVLPYTLAVAVLMVSRVPTYSGKALGARVSRELVLPILGIGAIAVVCLFAFTWEMLTALALVYLGLIPVGMRSYRRQQSDYEARMRRPADSA
jgi:CDP-diacylglycerol---serine O-phosphatidyltransferase